MIRISKQAFIQNFFRGSWLQLNPGVSANLDYSQPITAISSEELCENIFKKNPKC